MIALDRYGALLSMRDLRMSFAASMLGRLPIGVTGLAILFLVQTTSGSFARGGAAAGCYVTGLALVAPALGRAIDRYGPRSILLACALLFPCALLGLVEAVGQPILAAAFAALAGAAFPPITVCMRTYFRRRLVDDALLAAAYSIESVLIEIVFIVGPMVVALFLAFSSAAGAVWFAAGCGFAGTALFLRSPALRTWQVERQRAFTLLGPLADPGFPSVIVVILCFATTFGLVEIAITAYATERGEPALAGVLLGLMSAGSALGGFAYGSRSWHYPLGRQFAATLASIGIGLALLAIGWQPLAFAAWSMLAGIMMAPALIIQSMLVAKSARPEHSTEAFTWSTSALLAGVGVGLALGGWLLERFPSDVALGAAALAALVAAAGARVLLGR